MLVRYRVIQKYFEDEGWVTWGLLHENFSDLLPDLSIAFTAVPDDDRHVRRFLEARIHEYQPSLADGDLIIGGKYTGRFRVLPEVQVVEATTPREMRRRLWDCLFEEMEKRWAERPVEYAVPEPAYVPLREGSEEED